MSTYDVVLAGLGGQGILLASKVLMEQAIQRGVPVRGAETHGMAQRGGSVVAFVRIGACHGAEVLPRHAHLVLAFEPSEGLRALPFLRPGGTLLTNASAGHAPDAAVADYLQRLGARLVPIPATELAQRAGNVRSVNMVMVGAACGLVGSPFQLAALRDAVRALVKPRFLDANLQALSLGAAQL